MIMILILHCAASLSAQLAAVVANLGPSLEKLDLAVGPAFFGNPKP